MIYVNNSKQMLNYAYNRLISKLLALFSKIKKNIHNIVKRDKFVTIKNNYPLSYFWFQTNSFTPN